MGAECSAPVLALSDSQDSAEVSAEGSAPVGQNSPSPSWWLPRAQLRWRRESPNARTADGAYE